MNRLDANHYREALGFPSRKLAMVFKSVLVGAGSGAVVSFYRLVLGQAETWSGGIYGFFRGRPAMIPLLFLLLALAGYLVGTLAKRFPMIRGSGIPQVKGELTGHFDVPWFSTLVAKFWGGALSILAGLSLGREGPSIQLGAAAAKGIGQAWASSRAERRMMIAGGASAGLAAAFNAPLAGAMFAVEEIYKYLSPALLAVILVSAMAGDFVSKLAFGLSPVFSFHTTGEIPLRLYWVLLVLGVALGGAGALYNFTLLKTQKLYQCISRLPERARPVVPFLAAGVLGLVFPQVLGGGHAMLETLNPSSTLGMLCLLFLVKFLFSMVSFGSGAPGGIFFPLLILGGSLGAIAAKAAGAIVGPEFFDTFVVVAMAGYFAAIVRAPVTGTILLLEMTGSFDCLLPLIVVSFTAYLTADLLKSRPIYDSLLTNLLGGGRGEGCDPARKIVVEQVAHYDAPSAGRAVRDLGLPRQCLLIAIRREGEEVIPSGETLIRGGDYLTFLVNERDEGKTRSVLQKIFGEPE